VELQPKPWPYKLPVLALSSVPSVDALVPSDPEIIGDLKALLAGERFDAARETYLAALKAKTPVTILLEPVREKVDEAGRPRLTHLGWKRGAR